MSDKLELLQPEHFYHIFNRTNNKIPLFAQEKNYNFFLKRYKDYVHPFVDTYAYSLLSDHFHFLIRIKSEEAIKEANVQEGNLTFDKDTSIQHFVSQQFRRLFVSYSKAFNKQENRRGSLMERPFERKELRSENHFSYLCFYIHYNAQKHGLIDDYRIYRWSSYQAMLSSSSTLLKRQEVLDWYGGKEDFIHYHNVAERNRQEVYLLEA